MITATKIVKMVDQEDSEEYVEVVFHDGTFVALNEEELRNAAAGNRNSHGIRAGFGFLCPTWF
jgi:argininosuccinate synthase